MQTVYGGNGLKIKGEKPWNERKGIREILNAENGPAYCYDKESDDDAGDFTHLFVNFSQADAFQHEPEAMVSAPNDKVPACAMP